MRFFPAQKLRFIFVAYLALSVIGTFTFVAAADIPIFDFWKSESKTGGFITNVNTGYIIDCLTEYNVKIRGCSFSSSRKSMRVITSFGTLYAGIIALFSGMRITKPIKAPNSKKNQLLKLRI
jgi:hypothetical protein